jgi:lantibiotic modifying enzyme
MGGAVGDAFFIAHLYHTTKEEVYLDYCVDVFQKGAILIAEKQMDITFCNGIAGYCWAMEYLSKKQLIDKIPDSFFDAITPYIAKMGLWNFEQKNYDLLHGGIGYCQHLWEKEAFYEDIKKMIQALDETKINCDGGISWLNFHQLTKNNQVFDFGVAHGIPSILYFLAKAINLGIETERSNQLFEQALAFFVSYENKEQIFSFPSTLDRATQTLKPARLAWCYGDLGIAVTLYKTAQLINHQSLADKAIEIGLHTIKIRDIETAGIRDNEVNFCHGYYGIAYLYHKLYVLTDERKFLAAFDYWYKKSNDVLEQIILNNELEVVKDKGLLTGWSGIGLSILSMENLIDSEWSECLFV